MQISYKVPYIQQAEKDCLQASCAQLLQFHKVNKSITDVLREVPVYYTDDGEKLGSSIGHIASYLTKFSFHVTLHMLDTELFDRTWGNLAHEKIIEKLKERQEYILHGKYDKKAIEVIVSGYLLFLQSKGEIVFPILTRQYLIDLLKQGPFIAIVNWNYYTSRSKIRYEHDNQKEIPDDIEGKVATHAIVISGYENDKFCITDPDFFHNKLTKIDSDHLIGSICMAQSDMDCMLISMKPLTPGVGSL